MPFTVDDIVTLVRLKTRAPSTKILDSEIYKLVNAAKDSLVVPQLNQLREEWFIASEDQSIVANTATYLIPARAQGGGVRQVSYRDSQGNEIRIPQVPLDWAGRFEKRSVVSWPYHIAHAIEGDYIKLLPTPPTTVGTLRVRYSRRPGILSGVQESNCYLITNINVLTITLSVGANQATPDVAFTNGSLFDVHSSAPHSFRPLVDDKAITARTTTTVTLASAFPSTVQVGDWLCSKYYAAIPQLPVEWHETLVTAACVYVQRALGHQDQAESYSQELGRQFQQLVTSHKPRNTGGAIRPINRFSPLRWGRWG